MRETCFLLGEKHVKIFKILIKKWLLIISLSIKSLCTDYGNKILASKSKYTNKQTKHIRVILWFTVPIDLSIKLKFQLWNCNIVVDCNNDVLYNKAFRRSYSLNLVNWNVFHDNYWNMLSINALNMYILRHYPVQIILNN